VLAVVTFLVFAALAGGLASHTFSASDRVEAWVGAGLVGLGALALAAWAVVLTVDSPMYWAERLGGDLLLAGVGVGLLVAGVPTFAAGVI
jgi:hypothetical protein